MEALAIYQKIYAAWLGKLIGIRLGAPIEGWTYQQVHDTYGSIHGYLTDYGQFAADDDSNGPLFFARVMEDHSLQDVTAQAMGDNLLAWVSQRRGFFWWGGVGVSTEHTAWQNLSDGIPAPASGSRKQNGKGLSEQIGGQIFSDCWGYLSLGDVNEAARLAGLMSSVTHDGEGIQGGRFVAACIALAWQQQPIRQIVQQAQQVLDPASRYAALVNELLAFQQQHPDQPAACLKMLQQKHGYARYPGVCHILPNAAILIYGLLYGAGSFDRTMELIAEAGCDTDCNLGNAGSIVGMLVGLAGIDEKWIRPLQDILLASSSSGADNITTVSGSALYFTRLACRLHGIPLGVCAQPQPGVLAACFQLPYAVNGFAADSSRDHQVSLRAGNGALKIILDDVRAGQTFTVAKKLYFRPQDVYDDRYEPQFCPLAEPGDLICFELSGDLCRQLKIVPYVKGYDGQIYLGNAAGQHLKMTVPAAALPVLETGLQIESGQRIQHSWLLLTRFERIRQTQMTVNFADLAREDRGFDYGGIRHWTIAGLSCYAGRIQQRQSGLLLGRHAAVNFSGPDQQFARLGIDFNAGEAADLILAWEWRGSSHYRGIRYSRAGIFLVQQQPGKQRSQILLTANLNFFKNAECSLQIDIACGKITLVTKHTRQDFSGGNLISEGRGAAALINCSARNILVHRCILADANLNTREEKK